MSLKKQKRIISKKNQHKWIDLKISVHLVLTIIRPTVKKSAQLELGFNFIFGQFFKKLLQTT